MVLALILCLLQLLIYYRINRGPISDARDLSRAQIKVIPLPFSVVDAALNESVARLNRSQQSALRTGGWIERIRFLTRGKRTPSNRNEITTGSVSYEMHLITIPVGIIRIQMLPDNITAAYIIPYRAEKYPQLAEEYPRLLLALLNDAMDFVAVLIAQATRLNAQNELGVTGAFIDGTPAQPSTELTEAIEHATKGPGGRKQGSDPKAVEAAEKWLANTNVPQADIASEFGISVSTLQRAIRNKKT